uniref:HEAT repeat domain-containing protein n=1 Tax=candidate division WOR-3 bacterium TaxID=2052148 RepID=A0A7V0Z4B7_UNCW3
MTVNIQELAIDLIKTIKAAQIYQTSHPSFKNFFNQFYQDITEFLKASHEFILQVERFSIRYEDRIIYEETEKDISVAFRLFKDGIREIKFTEGITEDELLIFVEIVSKSDRDQDIALNLWECDFLHITFYVVEEEEDEKLSYALPELPKLEINYDEAVRGVLTREKIDFADKVSVEISPEELRMLKTEIAEIENQTDLNIVISTLIDVLKNTKSQEVIDALAEILELCINNNDFKNAILIVNYLWNYTDINLISRIENEGMIASFAELPDILDNQSFSDFVGLVGFFSKKTIPWFIRILKNVKNEERLRILQERLAYICQGDVEPVLIFLKEKDIKILTNAIVILGNIKNPSVIPHLKTLTLHPSPLVRKAIVDALTEFGEARMVSDFLADTDVNVRIKALQALEKLSYSPIYQKLIKTIKQRNFLNLNYNEQKAYFDCLVATGNKRLVKDLEKVLFKWVLFNRQKYLLKRQLSAQALAKIGNENAVSILRKGLKKRDEDIRAVCENVLKFIEGKKKSE